MAIARELGGSGAAIVLVESGGREPDAWSDALNQIESVGAPRVMDQTLVRNRVLGGTLRTWSGRIAAFDETDFQQRDWVPHSGWPLQRQQLARYLPRAMPYLGIAIPDNTDLDALLKVIGRAPGRPKFESSLLRDYFWSFSNDPAHPGEIMRFGNQAFLERSPNLRCLLNATVTHIDTNEAGSAVEGLEIMGRDRQTRRIQARFYILCAGGIENARLLLASNRRISCGVGNKNDLVGRFLMDHPRGVIGHFDSADLIRIQRLFGDYWLRMNNRRIKLTYGAALSPAIQRSEGLLNCSTWITGDRSPDDPWVSARNIIKRHGGAVRNLTNVLRTPLTMAESVKRYIVDRRSLLMLMNTVTLECIVEQQPDPDSRITLSDKIDALGQPLARIDWHIHEQEARTVRYMGRLFAQEMRRLGLPVPILNEMITNPQAPFFLPDVAHPTGTTRMADTERSGVVDANGAVFGVQGLYIAGSSTFPTSGHANPTQTIVAMAVRLADHLKEQLHNALAA
jgi:choline dehydrogenase-like flavoprotein